ncbi:DUF418 domain-containing protein [Thalassotalea fusca]
MTVDLSQPIQSQDRLVNIDIIRGIALLGILVMNIQAFSMNFAAYMNPTVYGDLTGANYYVYYFSHLFADQKFMSIFSMLFGAGIVLMAQNIERKGGNAKRIHYKRMFILALVGLAHAYLLWFGDILLPYALAGMVVFLARNKSPKFLLITGTSLIAICGLLFWSVSMAVPFMSEQELTEMMAMWSPSKELIAQDIAANQASWVGQAEQRINMAAMAQGNVLFYMPRVIGLMMFGMALFKLDFFGERFRTKSLLIAGVSACAIALYLITTGVEASFARGWDLTTMFTETQYNYWGSIIMALGYMCLLVCFCRSTVLSKLKALLANVGRMALTNYLSHTIICCVIFYGWGLGFYGTFERTEQIMLVMAIWLFQIFFSTFWMNRYRFGPFEWVWRSLTYGKLQPLAKLEVATN